MKDKLLLFMIGVLVGAIISTGAFYVYTKTATCSTNNGNQMSMPGGNPPSMPNGELPERPDGNNTQMNNN